MFHKLKVCISLAAVAWATAAAGVTVRSDAGDTVWTDREQEDFLLRAEIVQSKKLSIGVTASRRATLSLDGRSHDAHIQAVDVMAHKTVLDGRTRLGFRDCYRYNIAAYRLDRMLGLGMVPVSVERTVDGRKSAVTWWVDDVRMMEQERVEKRIEPPHPRTWMAQSYRRRIFNELAYNTDFNQGNLLITNDWKTWLIDYTRAFWPVKELFNPANLWQPDQPLLERLRALTPEQVDGRLGACLTRSERRALLVRRDLILQHFERKAADQARAIATVN